MIIIVIVNMKQCSLIIFRRHIMKLWFSVTGYIMTVIALLIAADMSAQTVVPLPRQGQFRPDTAREDAALKDTAVHRIAMSWRNDPLKGMREADAIIQRAGREGDSTRLALAFYALGVNQWALGKNVESAKSYFSAYEIAYRTRNRVILGITSNNIGLLYYSIGIYEEAENWFGTALIVRQQIRDTAGLGRVLSNLGLVIRKTQSPDSARSRFQQALQLLVQSGDSVNIARTTHYIGETWAATGEYQNALTYYTRAEEVFGRVNDEMGHALLLVDIARAHFALGRAEAALLYAQSAMDAGQQIPSPFTLHEAADILHQLYAAKGEYRYAYEILSQASVAADSLRNEAKMHAIAAMELRFMIERERMIETQQAEQRDRRIQEKLQQERDIRNIVLAGLLVVLLVAGGLWVGIRKIRKANRIITEKNEHIEAINQKLGRLHEARERLFSIIGHDLRGPIGAIVSITELLKEREDDLSHSEISHLNEAIAVSARATYDLLDNLLNWSRSHYGGLSFDAREQDIGTLIDELLAMYRASADKKNITINRVGPASLLATFDHTMMGVILRNLIMNAIKFTPAGGSITVETLQHEGLLRISIRDTGVGMSRERLEAIRQRDELRPLSGTDGEQGTGLGLEVVREFLRCHQGRLDIDSVQGEGSVFTITVPVQGPGNDTKAVESDT
jgi:signal transduction histidine kinase